MSWYISWSNQNILLIKYIITIHTITRNCHCSVRDSQPIYMWIKAFMRKNCDNIKLIIGHFSKQDEMLQSDKPTNTTKTITIHKKPPLTLMFVLLFSLRSDVTSWMMMMMMSPRSGFCHLKGYHRKWKVILKKQIGHQLKQYFNYFHKGKIFFIRNVL